MSISPNAGQFSSLVPKLRTEAAVHGTSGGRRKLAAEIHSGLDALRARLTAERAGKQPPFDTNTRILASLATLHERTAQTDEALEALASAPHAAHAEADLAPV